jgi:phytoene synthase
MDINNRIIFRKGSKTFFYATLFFPKKKRKQITSLYAFVRTVDDFVDRIPQDKKGFLNFKELYYKALVGQQVQSSIINQFILLQKDLAFEQVWIDSFFKAMESDLNFNHYQTLRQTEDYMYGSAEVIGLMMSKIMEVVPENYFFAQKLGQAFQYINFIRDLAEDQKLGRSYLPADFYFKFNLKSLTKEEVFSKPEEFKRFFRNQIDYFYSLIDEAKLGFSFIPKRYQKPIKIATNLYLWTASVIYKNPLIVFDKKVKPSKMRLVLETLKIILNFKNDNKK